MFQRFIAVLILSFSLPIPSYSEGPDRLMQGLVRTGSMSKEDADLVSGSLGVSFDSIFKNLMAANSTKVVKIIRKDEGIPFSVVKNKKRRSHLSAGKKREIAKRYKQKLASGAIEAKQLRDIPNCTQSRTEVKNRDVPAQPERVFYDVLYVRSNYIFDINALSNPKPRVRKFDPTKLTADTLTTLDQKIPCLPYRVRATTKTVAKYAGEAALNVPSISSQEK